MSTDDYSDCTTCTTSVLTVQAHRFVGADGRKSGTYCDLCCTRCNP